MSSPAIWKVYAGAPPGGQRIALTVLKPQAYLGPHDLAYHAVHPRTARTEAMHGPPGTFFLPGPALP